MTKFIKVSNPAIVPQEEGHIITISRFGQIIEVFYKNKQFRMTGFGRTKNISFMLAVWMCAEYRHSKIK